jgi:hypothetical protein
MWSFFWVLLIGGYWIIRLLNESGNKFAYQMRDEENKVKYDGLYADNDWELRRNIEKLLISHPFYFSKDYCGEKVDEFEMIMDDLHDIFGDHIEYVSSCGWFQFDRLITNLIHSKSSKTVTIWYNLPEGVPRYRGYYENQPIYCGEVCDLHSYKNIIGLRYYKKIEENIRKKYPDFAFVYYNDGKKYDIIKNKLSIYHEESFSNQAISRRLWDDEPLSPDTAPTPIAPPNDYWKTK